MNLTFRKKSEMAKKKSLFGEMLKLNNKSNRQNKKPVLSP
jgi:hypothetical protein